MDGVCFWRVCRDFFFFGKGEKGGAVSLEGSAIVS